MSPTDIAVLATVVGSVVLFGGIIVLALGWAFRDGQFDNFQQGAASIFGPDEPVGETTDAFPGEDPREADRVAIPMGVGDAEGNGAVISTPAGERPWLHEPSEARTQPVPPPGPGSVTSTPEQERPWLNR